MQRRERQDRQVIQALAALAVAEPPFDHVLQSLCECLSAQAHALGVAIAALDADRSPWLTAGTAETRELAADQFALREGPCVDACARGEPVGARCAAATKRWPRWAPKAVRMGVDGVVSIPLGASEGREQPLGTVWLAFAQAPQWAADDQLLSAASAAAIALHRLVWHRQLEAQRQEVSQLEHALVSRVVIEQAKGFVAAREGLSLEKAFERLRRKARSSQRRLREVAAEALREGGVLL